LNEKAALGALLHQRILKNKYNITTLYKRKTLEFMSKLLLTYNALGNLISLS